MNEPNPAFDAHLEQTVPNPNGYTKWSVADGRTDIQPGIKRAAEGYDTPSEALIAYRRAKGLV